MPPSKLHSAEGSSGIQTPDRRSSGHQYTEPVSEGEEDEEMDLAPARDERQRMGISGQELDEAIAYRERMLKERQATSTSRNGEGQSGEGANERTPFLKNNTSTAEHIRPRALSIDPLAPSHAFDRTLRERLGGELESSAAATTNQDNTGTGDDEEEQALRSDERILSRDFRAPEGKRIAVPVRIEPKVYFASERTFLVRFPSLAESRGELNRSTEMAPLLGLRRNDRHGAPQLRRTGRHTRSGRRCDVHFRGSAHYCVLCRYLRPQRAKVEDEERGRVVL